jgi:Neuraminidase (sialidase)
MDFRPRLAGDGAGAWIVVWQAYDPRGGPLGTDADVLAARSLDGGRTWSRPAPLNANAARDRGEDQSPQIATDGRGTWIAAWSSTDALDGTLGDDPDVLFARSVDRGATWSPPVPLAANAATDAGGDWAPQVVTDGQGTWLAVWWSNDTLGGTLGEDHDVLVARSTDAGLTWTPAAPLHENAGRDAGDDRCPQLATDGKGAWVAVWESTDPLGGAIGTDKDVLVARSTDGGRTWTPPAPLDARAGDDTDVDAEPRIATDGAGTWVALWQSTETRAGMMRHETRVVASRSTDGGVTWTAPVVLDGGAVRGRAALLPQLAADSARAWAAAWVVRGPDGTRTVWTRAPAGAATWAEPAPLGGGRRGEDGAPDVASDGRGGWIVAWDGRLSDGADHDVFLTLRRGR